MSTKVPLSKKQLDLLWDVVNFYRDMVRDTGTDPAIADDYPNESYQSFEEERQEIEELCQSITTWDSVEEDSCLTTNSDSNVAPINPTKS